MMTITEFLESRIAEDEAQAKYVQSWGSSGPAPLFGSARALAECAAKRAIMALHENYTDFTGGPSGNCLACTDSLYEADVEGADRVDFPCPTLKALAAVYADREDYQQEWKP